MFTINSKLGIGKVTEMTDSTVTVYFDEVEETKVLARDFTKIYATEEDAENSKVMSPELMARVYAEMQAEAEAYRLGGIAMANIEEINREAARKLMSIR